MDEDYFALLDEDDVGVARQKPVMQAIPESETPKEAANAQFRLRILVPNPAHAFASFGWG